MVLLPNRGSTIVLRTQSGEAHRGQVVGNSPGQVAFELEDDYDRTFMIDERVLVTWPDPLGVTCLPSVIVDTPLYEDRAWLAQAVGEAWNEQRRAYVRAALTGTVALRRVGDDGLNIAVGDLIDLSEAGLRCSISERHAALAEPGTEVTLTLELEQDEFELPGKVLYGRHTARSDGRLEFVVIFDRPVVQVDRLRFHIKRSERKADKNNVVELSGRRKSV
jgi:PilZ domain